MKKTKDKKAMAQLDRIADIHATAITMNYVLDNMVLNYIDAIKNYPELKNGNLAADINSLGVLLEREARNINELLFPEGTIHDLLNGSDVLYFNMVSNHCSDEIQKKMRENIA
ncbi:hypothetical protein [Butyrivibrio sp. INlla14]|uniref:hypothetical protein n=1 Tax=Butyrivibrio sp. INlla14 TaxID=1520808 RepID=UPI000876C26B|nr:hypothetical protein [Butyrivibrio sp. INlla14]SCY68967.1 hypothetical protein SAMN02910371_03396 [Butyrivibrio sp. INlla14]